jgi:hypothetical protein
MDADQRLESIDRRLQLLEDRLAALERGRAEPVAEPAEDAASPEPASAPSLLALTGKSMVILGGAFLLRSATESAALPRHGGVILGVLYASAWIVAAWRAAAAQRPLVAGFHCAVAAIVAYPIVWEATLRFKVLPAVLAALLLAAFSIALLLLAQRHALQSPAWIAVAGVTIDALLLAYGTRELIPLLLALTLTGVCALLLSMREAGWLVALESDLFAIALIVLALFRQSKESWGAIVVALLLFAVGWSVVARRAGAQTAAATLIAIAAASAFVLPFSATAILWGIAGVVAAEIARRTGDPAFAIQSIVWCVLAAIAGGLMTLVAETLLEHGTPAAMPLVPLAVAGLALCAALRLELGRIVPFAIAMCGVLAMAIRGADAVGGSAAESLPAVVRTVVLAAGAVALAAAGRRWGNREASQLAAVLLVATGVKLVAQEFRGGTAAIIFVSLAVYGSAMLVIARLRGPAAIS